MDRDSAVTQYLVHRAMAVMGGMARRALERDVVRFGTVQEEFMMETIRANKVGEG